MSDHQFEKNVKKQLEELRFHPDASVWTAVEKRIADRKKKRRGLVWLPVLFLLIAGGIFLLDRGNKNNTSFTEVSTKVSPREEGASSGTVPETKQSEVTATETPASKQRSNAGSNENQQPSGAGINAGNDPEKGSKVSPGNKVMPGGTEPLHSAAQIITIKKSSRKTGAKITTNDKNILKPETTTPGYSGDGTGTTTTVPKQSLSGEVSSRNSSRSFSHSIVFASVIPLLNKDHDQTLSSVSTVLTPTLPAILDSNGVILTKQLSTFPTDSVASIAAVPRVEKRKEKIQWGISIDGGFSNVTEGLFKALDGTQKSLVQDVASNSYSSPLPANAVLPMPSDIRPGPAFGAGVFIRKAVSKRIAISAGLGYSLLQTSIQVGLYTQSSMTVLNARGSIGVEAVYRAGTQQEYNNQYHFVELPLEASFRLNRRRQYPIALNAGMSVARLISSNALHFDGATRVYYEDNSLFNKTQVGFSGGLSIGMLQRTAHPVSVGPFLHYRATSLMKYALNGERHLLSYGMNLKVLLSK